MTVEILPSLSILIPAYNEEGEIGETLACARESVEKAGLRGWDIIVCDNNSTDKTAVIAQAAGAQVVFEPHNQIARARNRAAEVARGDWLLFLDADTRLSPSLLAAALKKMVQPDIVGGGALVSFSGEIPPVFRVLVNVWNKMSVGFGWAAGCFLFCRRSAWREVGGFDARYYASEEVWFSRRLTRWGRAHNQRFEILTNPRVVTSGRKFRWFKTTRLLIHLVLLSVPGALRFQKTCGLWYQRPTKR